MNENKNITPYNNKQQRHGYWEVYVNNGDKLWYKRYYLNDKLSSYSEYYFHDYKMNIKFHL